MTVKCKPGKVSRTVSTSPLTLDLTVECTSGVEVPPPKASTQVVLPPATVAHTVTAAGTSMPFVATPAPVVEQPGCMPRGFQHSGYWSPPSYFRRPHLPRPRCRGEQRRTRRRPFRPTVYRRGPHRMLRTRTVCSLCHRFHQDSSFGLLGGADRLRLDGSYCRRTLDDFDDSVLGDPITYAWCEQFPGSESPLSLPVYAWPSGSAFLLDSTMCQTVLAPGSSTLPVEGPSTSAPPLASGEGRLLEAGLPGCPYRFSESGDLPFTVGNRAYGLQLYHPRFLELVGLLDCSPTFWVDQLGKEQAMAVAINLQRDSGVMLSNLQILSQFSMAMNRMSFSMMALGLGQSLFPRVEVDDLAPALRAARAASYMSAMGLWHPQTGPGFPGPVPVSSCRSCLCCKYCFPEDQLPPG